MTGKVTHMKKPGGFLRFLGTRRRTLFFQKTKKWTTNPVPTVHIWAIQRSRGGLDMGNQNPREKKRRIAREGSSLAKEFPEVASGGWKSDYTMKKVYRHEMNATQSQKQIFDTII